jgi:hypothetical protein
MRRRMPLNPGGRSAAATAGRAVSAACRAVHACKARRSTRPTAALCDSDRGSIIAGRALRHVILRPSSAVLGYGNAQLRFGWCSDTAGGGRGAIVVGRTRRGCATPSNIPGRSACVLSGIRGELARQGSAPDYTCVLLTRQTLDL